MNAYDEQETLDDDAIPFLISKRKMMDKYEESRKRVVDINGTSLLKILSKEAKQTLGSNNLRLSNIDLHVGSIPDHDQQLLIPPSCVADPVQLDIVSIIRLCGRNDVVREDLFNSLIFASHNADRVIRVSWSLLY